MEILKGIEIIDLALFIKKKQVLVLGDVHLGIEGAYQEGGVLLPKFQYEDVKKRVGAILNKTHPKTIIVNGDLKHEFGRISREEWREVLDFTDMLLGYGMVTFVKGNHDKILKPLAERRNIEIVKVFHVNGIGICHGDFIPKDIEKNQIIIIGHEHPSISLRDETKKEMYKCYLKGKYKKTNLIVMPSFNLLIEGSDVLKENLLSPFLKNGVEDFDAYIVGDRVYKFGKVKDF